MQLKRFRLERKLTKDQMSQLVGISRSMYEKIERGERTPSVETIKKFKKAFKELDINIFLT